MSFSIVLKFLIPHFWFCNYFWVHIVIHFCWIFNGCVQNSLDDNNSIWKKKHKNVFSMFSSFFGSQTKILWMTWVLSIFPPFQNLKILYNSSFSNVILWKMFFFSFILPVHNPLQRVSHQIAGFQSKKGHSSFVWWNFYGHFISKR